MAIKGYWRMNGNSNDASGNALNGSDTNITYNNGVAIFGVNSAMSIGDTALVDFGDSFAFSFTVSSVTYLSGPNIIISKDSNTGRQFVVALDGLENGTKNISLFYWTASNVLNYWYTSTVDLSSNKQRHIVVGKNSTTRFIYIDGVPVALTSVGTLGNTVAATSTPLLFGDRYYASSHSYFRGNVGEIIINNNMPAPAQIKNEYSRVKGFF